MTLFKRLNLQLFGGEGAGDGGGEGVGTSVGGDTNVANSADDGQKRLMELGVPEHLAKKHSVRMTSKKAISQQISPDAPKQVATAEQTQSETPPEEATDVHTDGTEENKPARMTWDEIKEDPEYKKEIQAIVQARLKNAKASEETLAKLAPAIEVLARKYKLDPTNPDYDALTEAINNDDEYYEGRAIEMGVPVETAKRIDRNERDNARREREAARTLEQERFDNHLRSLEAQGTALKAVFPDFNLREELKNPTFARMTSPNGGISVEDAYYAIHRKELQSAAMQVAAQKTAEKLSSAIQAGQRRPSENGTSGQAPSVTTFDYRNASREQREALKRRIRSGERIVPGQEI